MLPIYYLIPLLSGVLYAVGALLAKRALDNGMGVYRYLFLSNLSIAILFLPFICFVNEPIPWQLIGWPLCSSLGFFLGQMFTFFAIRYGDVSVQAPVMGTKVLFVALFSLLLQAGPVPVSWWIGAFLTTTAIFLLSYSNLKDRKATLITLVLSLISAAFFALVDTIVQREAPAFGPSAFLVLTMGGVGLLSFTLIPFFRGRLRDLSAAAWKWGLLSTTIIAVQSMGIAYAIGFYGHATAVNIMYSSRGLWSVVLVWIAGRWFANREGEAGKTVMLRRFAGSVLLCLAIFLVLAFPQH